MSTLPRRALVALVVVLAVASCAEETAPSIVYDDPCGPAVTMTQPEYCARMTSSFNASCAAGTGIAMHCADLYPAHRQIDETETRCSDNPWITRCVDSANAADGTQESCKAALHSCVGNYSDNIYE